jgi:Reverse transcriptase (RNA-dependent DNA polymerase)/Aspartyl protease
LIRLRRRAVPETTKDSNCVSAYNKHTCHSSEIRIPQFAYPSNLESSNNPQLNVPLTITDPRTQRSDQVQALVDSGSTLTCIDQSFAKAKGYEFKPITPIKVYNADGTPNSKGQVTHVVTLDLTLRGNRRTMDLAVIDLGNDHLYLGYNWLRMTNPIIDWEKGTLHLPHEVEEVEEDQELPNLEEIDDDNDEETEIRKYLRSTTLSTKLAQAENAAKESRTLDQIVPDTYKECMDIFEKQTFDELPPHRPWDHAIDIVKGADIHIDAKLYPLAPRQQEELDKFLEENLSTGRIRPSRSPLSSSFFFVDKKDGKLRPTQDYRKLNDITIKNRYPLPLIPELVDKIKNDQYFSKFDIRWGFNNIRIKAGDEWKAAFKTNRGMFEPLVMFFGLCNSPATFQHMMDTIFRAEISEGWLAVYMDDMLIYSPDLALHQERTKRVLQKLRDYKLSLKAEKCRFDVQEVDFLGLVIRPGETKMDPVKTKAIAEWPVPQNLKQLQSFLGFLNFYRRFIPSFSHIARPLHSLTGHVPW